MTEGTTLKFDKKVLFLSIIIAAFVGVLVAVLEVAY